MSTFVILSILILAALAATVHDLRDGGHGAAPPPASHHVDPDAVPPAQRLSR